TAEKLKITITFSFELIVILIIQSEFLFWCTVFHEHIVAGTDNVEVSDDSQHTRHFIQYEDTQQCSEQDCRIEKYRYFPGRCKAVCDRQSELTEGYKNTCMNQHDQLFESHRFILKDEKRQQRHC